MDVERLMTEAWNNDGYKCLAHYVASSQRMTQAQSRLMETVRAINENGRIDLSTLPDSPTDDYIARSLHAAECAVMEANTALLRWYEEAMRRAKV